MSDRLAHVERMLDLIGDIDPTDPDEVALLDERDALRHELTKEHQ